MKRARRDLRKEIRALRALSRLGPMNAERYVADLLLFGFIYLDQRAEEDARETRFDLCNADVQNRIRGLGGLWTLVERRAYPATTVRDLTQYGRTILDHMGRVIHAASGYVLMSGGECFRWDEYYNHRRAMTRSRAYGWAHVFFNENWTLNPATGRLNPATGRVVYAPRPLRDPVP